MVGSSRNTSSLLLSVIAAADGLTTDDGPQLAPTAAPS
jgi:hypothetical protein